MRGQKMVWSLEEGLRRLQPVCGEERLQSLCCQEGLWSVQPLCGEEGL